ncbi:MAG: acyl-CoA-binding protein [Chloroflexota bacterium]|nr:acyl-CoA-binding protein [Chloroflexota bacterium]
MTKLRQEFEQATVDSKALKQRPPDQTLLKLYALYKQATEGDVTGERPGFRDMKGRFKYDAWAKTRGMSSEDAMQGYVDLVGGLKAKES